MKDVFDKQLGTLRETGSFSKFLKLGGNITKLEIQTVSWGN